MAPRGCSIEDCDNPHEAKGFCRKHYRRTPEQMQYDKQYRRPYYKKYLRTTRGRWCVLQVAARRLGLGIDISEEAYGKLVEGARCSYCGNDLSRQAGHCLDRKDSNVGYLVENVVPCCLPCNRIKNAYLTYDEMVVAMRAVLQHRKANGA